MCFYFVIEGPEEGLVIQVIGKGLIFYRGAGKIVIKGDEKGLVLLWGN